MIVVVVVVVLVVAAGAAWLVRRRGGDDTHSVEGYRNTLDTLQGIRSRTPSTVRLLGRDDDPPDADEPGPAAGPGAPAAGRTGYPRPGTGPGQNLVFEEPSTRSPGAVPAPGGRHRRTQDRAISAMNHRPRRWGAPALVAVVVVAVLVAIILIGAHARHPKSSTTTTGPRSNPTTTAGGASTGGNGTTTTSKPARTTTTTTTVPPSFTAITFTSTTATYVPPAAAYTVTLSATTGQCWLTVKSSTGTTVFSQTLGPGQSKTLTLTGTSTIVIGAPTVVAVTVDQKPVVLPTGYRTPFLMTLQPS